MLEKLSTIARKAPGSNVSEAQNAAKTLLSNIRFVSVDDPIKSIVVTSSVPNEGKTTTSFLLAQAIATSDKTVILVEADMRRRSVATMLGTTAPYGYHSVLSKKTRLQDAIVKTKVDKLYFLDVEPGIPNPADVLTSRHFRSMTEALRNEFDYVIYDTPPTTVFVDASILSTLVDATILVVRPDLVKRDDLMHAHEQLKNANANLIGICCTFAESTNSEYYYYYDDEKEQREPNVFPGIEPDGTDNAAREGGDGDDVGDGVRDDGDGGGLPDETAEGFRAAEGLGDAGDQRDAETSRDAEDPGDTEDPGTTEASRSTRGPRATRGLRSAESPKHADPSRSRRRRFR